MKIARSGWWSLVACVSVACGGAPKPPPLSAEVAIAPKGAAVYVPDAPVPAPAGVIAVGRARDYRQWVKLEQASPVMAYLKKKLIEDQGDALLEDLDLTQSIEFVATYEPNFRRTPDPPADGEAAAEPVPEDTFDHLFAAISLPLTRYAPESYEHLGFKRWTSNAYERGNCLVTPALGAAQARLVCSDRPEVTRHFYGYLARGLPLEPLSPAPLFVELRAQPLKELWGPSRKSVLESLNGLAEIGGNTGRLAKDLSSSVAQEADAWVASVDTLRFEGGPNERGEFEANATLALRSPEPWLVQSSLASAAKINGAPSAFLSLPKQVEAGGYSYGMPAERAVVLQSALVNLAQTALQEFGPVSRLDPVEFKGEKGKAVDRLVTELVATLDSPCLRADQTVLANIPGDPSEINAYLTPKKAELAKPLPHAPMIPLDVLARVTLGQYLVATPSAAGCREFTDNWLEMLTTLLQALPAKDKKELPITTSVRKNVKLKGLPPATVTHFSLTKQAVTQLVKEFKPDGAAALSHDSNKIDSAFDHWGAPKGPMLLSVIVVPAADSTGSDWIGLGLDEKQLVQALVQATHPEPGQTLAARSELAPFIARNPTSLSFQSFEAHSRLMALMGGPELGPALTGLQSLFHGTHVVSTTRVTRRGDVVEAGFSYNLSKEGLDAIRQILSWDIERLLEVAKQMNPAQSAEGFKPNTTK